METKALKPTISLKLQSSTAVHSAPLWLMKPTLPGRAMPRREGGVQAGERAHHAQAVGADDAHVALARFLEQLPLQLRALRPDFLEAGRDHDRRLDARRRALPDDSRE